jgi:hypothetical protein
MGVKSYGFSGCEGTLQRPPHEDDSAKAGRKEANAAVLFAVVDLYNDQRMIMANP